MNHREAAVNHLRLASDTANHYKGEDPDHPLARRMQMDMYLRIGAAITHALLAVATAIRPAHHDDEGD